MSRNTVTNNGSQQKQMQTNLAKLFLFGKEIKQYDHTNSTYDTEELAAGTVMGVVSATGEVVPFDSTATDGSEYPCLILGFDYSVEEGETQTVGVATRGEVRADMLVFANEDDSLETVIDGRRVHEILEDRFVLRSVTNGTRFDNEI